MIQWDQDNHHRKCFNNYFVITSFLFTFKIRDDSDKQETPGDEFYKHVKTMAFDDNSEKKKKEKVPPLKISKSVVDDKDDDYKKEKKGIVTQ